MTVCHPGERLRMTQRNSFQATKDGFDFFLALSQLLLACHASPAETSYLAAHLASRSRPGAYLPLKRLIKSGILSKMREAVLLETRNAINILVLRSQIDILISHLLALPCLKRGEMVDFYQTRHNRKEPSVTLSFEPTITLR